MKTIPGVAAYSKMKTMFKLKLVFSVLFAK